MFTYSYQVQQPNSQPPSHIHQPKLQIKFLIMNIVMYVFQLSQPKSHYMYGISNQIKKKLNYNNKLNS